MILADCHTHCFFSSDSDALPEDMAALAQSKGLSYLCFTDHMDLDYPETAAGQPLFTFSPEEYFKRLMPLRQQTLRPMPLGQQTLSFDAASALRIRIGIELGLSAHRPDTVAQQRKLLSAYPFDFVLASIHTVDGEDPYYGTYWQGVTKETALARYFDAMLTSITEFPDFDCLSHLDYIIRYIPAFAGTKDYRYSDYKEVLDEILRFLITEGKALEINTKGLSAGLRCFHPMPDVLARYRELGGTLLTIGSDAHEPSAIAAGYETTRELLLSRGFTSYCVFTERTPELFYL